MRRYAAVGIAVLLVVAANAQTPHLLGTVRHVARVSACAESIAEVTFRVRAPGQAVQFDAPEWSPC